MDFFYTTILVPTHVSLLPSWGSGGQKRERIKQDLEEATTIIKYLESNDRFADNLLMDLADGKLEGGCHLLLIPVAHYIETLPWNFAMIS